MLFTILANTYQIPTPKLYAVYKPDGNFADFIERKLTSIEEVKSFFSGATYPIFAKPVKGNLGTGAICISDYCRETDTIKKADGNELSFEEFLQKTINHKAKRYVKKAGYLFQQSVIQHDEITEFTGSTTPSGFRFVVLNMADGPKIHRVIWKIVSKGNINDNFNVGKTGNLIVNVCPETGSLSDAVTACWPFAEYKSAHEVTKRKFKDFNIPIWESIASSVKRASGFFTDIKILHWDIIVTNDGPVMLELNDIGGTDILQMHEKGLIDETLRAFLRKEGNLEMNTKLKKMLLR
ncbi:hypothetical protein GCM10011357_33000 [Lacimicrobium alkaliphilum]|uniref:Alpha-L-glutamate ligase-related protein ATP-grasp domain-containing protein n=2 Tax=Lacimicrobium alkaliphilum TaxID=1526571 RepID=A0ABQ1RMG0_9ALTE|nr:hypothetical protein GCM10011357_33000 [Lacimicrobium alkaliphilum]